MMSPLFAGVLMIFCGDGARGCAAASTAILLLAVLVFSGSLVNSQQTSTEV